MTTTPIDNNDASDRNGDDRYTVPGLERGLR